MIFERTRSRNTLDWVAKQVKRLRPGERIEVAEGILQDIDCDRHNGARWTPADRVLENIMGSSVEYRYMTDWAGRTVFERLAQPLTDGRRSYVSPDRRNLFLGFNGGTWSPKPNELPSEDSSKP